MSRGLKRYMADSKRAADAGVEAHVRLTLARQLRESARKCRMAYLYGIPNMDDLAAELRRRAANLDAQRRRIEARKGNQDA